MIEMLFIVSIISVISMPVFVNGYENLILKWNMQQLLDYFYYKKNESILLKKQNEIVIENNTLISNDEKIVLDSNVYCESYVIQLNERGNVDRGGSFTCSYKNKEMYVVIQLGSGFIHVR